MKRIAVAAGMTPRGAFIDIAEVAGKQLASPLRQGQIPTEAQLLGPGLLSGASPGTAAVPLRLADPSSIQLLAPGQLINVVLAQSDSRLGGPGNQILAQSVPVLWTAARGGSAGQWLGTGDHEGLVVVAADQEQSRKLAGASTQGKLFFVLVNGP
ncbi:Flp pilus assembly protein CpaB [Arthrobacter sp. M4]|nr:RcpC/CpaB family pilus assembly protein [Arthrobacter sp. M4]MCA4132423.1 Flp pilus assembly protein CpaB [Arthrobacter sp. M4]